MIIRMIKNSNFFKFILAGLLIGLIALAVIVAVGLLGTTISNIFSDIGTTLSGAGIPTSS